MNIVGEIVDYRTLDILFIEAGLLASCCADAGYRSTNIRSGAAEVESVFIDFIEEFLCAVGSGADKHDIAGLTVKCHQA